MNLSVATVAMIAIAVVFYAIAVHNTLVRRRNLAKEAWSGIDVQLRQRFDLIPNLVQTVQAYAAHEKGILEEIAAQRASGMNAGTVNDKAHADNALSGVLGRLFAVVEAYPALKADANFANLQNELAEIEDQLQMARRYYNGAARELNVLVESFPSLLVAKACGFEQAPYFESDEAATAVPPVIFGESK